jgi:hypothetical protein
MPLVGAMDFVTMHRSGSIAPEIVVDLKCADGLGVLDLDETRLTLGATVTKTRVSESSEPCLPY